MSISRRIHRSIGWCLILPFTVWALTGLIFFIKPGYQAAFASLSVKTYPVKQVIHINPQPQWQEIKLLQSVLGLHLLVRDSDGWHQLNPDDLTLRPEPSETELELLIQDAIQLEAERYGKLLQPTGRGFITETGVQIQLDWPSLTLSQQGKDTDVINNLYKAHYLQWTGEKTLDQVLGILGLVLLLLSTFVGFRLLLQRR